MSHPVRMRRAAVLIGLSVGLVAGRAREARAQTASEISSARQWFAEGLLREENSEWPQALALFRRAAQIKRTPQIVFHVGLCESRTGALVEAMVDLDRAASSAKDARADDVAAAAGAELAEVKRRVPTLEVHAAEGATVLRFLVDGTQVATAMLGTAMALDPGQHALTIELASGASATKIVSLAERDVQQLVLAPEAPAAPAAVTAPLAGPPRPRESAAPSTGSATGGASATVAWALVGGGAAILAGGVALFAVARAKESTLSDACPSRLSCDDSLQSKYDSAKTFNALGLVLGAAGVVAVGAGVTLIALRPASPAAPRAALVASPRGVGLVGRF